MPYYRAKTCGCELLSAFDLSTAFPLCCRYTVVNEINKVDLGEVSVFVYFIMKLSRVEGGMSYVGFHGGGSSDLSLLTLQLASGKHTRATLLLFTFPFNA